MPSDYMEYIADFTEPMDDLDTTNDDDLSTEEALHYAQVISRISQKLMSIS